MRASDERSETTLILGGGLAGLMTGAKLAMAGCQVIVCDRHSEAGGLHGIVDVGKAKVPLIAYKGLNLNAGSQLRNFIEQCAGGTIAIRRMEISDHVFFEDDEVVLYTDPAKAKETLTKRFPEEREGIERVIDALTAIYDELTRRPGLGLDQKAGSAVREASGRSYREFLEESVHAQKLCAAFSVRIFSSQNDLLTMGAYLGSIWRDGLHWILDGSKYLTDMFAGVIRKTPGCALRLNARVERFITHEDGQVAGVLMADGITLHAQHIVVACDPQQAAELLPASESKAELIETIENGVRSLSAWIGIFVMKPSFLPRLAAHEGTARLQVCQTADCVEVYRRRETGVADVSMAKITWDLHPSDGEVRMPVLYVELDCSSSATHDAQAMELAMMRAVERVFAGFAGEIEEFRVVAPEELAGLTRSVGGACSGWATGGRPARLDEQLWRLNLQLVGQWSKFGTGLPMLEQSADQVSRRIVRENRQRGIKEISTGSGEVCLGDRVRASVHVVSEKTGGITC